jgi:hypothetical protein
MNQNKMKWLGWAVLGMLLATVRAQAATPTAFLNIDVAVTANLSVSVNGVASSTDTSVAAWNTAIPNAKIVGSSATVLNDSGGQTEKWALSMDATSLDTTGGGLTWSRSASSSSVGADAFALQAVFGSSNTAGAGCPIATASDWNNGYAAVLQTTPQTYMSNLYADPNLVNAGGSYQPDVTANGRMYAGSKRALCWRIITPNSTSVLNAQNVQIIVTAQNP